MTRSVIISKSAPGAIGPYSQAILIEETGLIFVSGQLALDPGTGKLVSGTMAEKTRQCIKNISAILEAAGSSLDRIVKTTIFLTDMADFQEVNGEYAAFFKEAPPARSCVAVAGLPLGASIEIEVIAQI